MNAITTTQAHLDHMADMTHQRLRDRIRTEEAEAQATGWQPGDRATWHGHEIVVLERPDIGGHVRVRDAEAEQGWFQVDMEELF